MHSNINDKIAIIDGNIYKNIDKNKDNRGFLSQNILNGLRNLVEHIALKIHNEDNQQDLDNDYKHLIKGINYIKSKAEFKFLYKFHNFLQISVSHYTQNEQVAELLMLKYYEYLIKTKSLMKEKYNFNILDNLSDFPLKINGAEQEYYEEISKLLESTSFDSVQRNRYYIHKIKPFFVNKQIYYEVSFTAASDKVSKFDKILAFSKENIMPNYAVRLGVQDVNLIFRGKKFPTKIIKEWRIDIRPCEIDNFCKIFKLDAPKINRTALYDEFMKFLNEEQLTLLELIELNDDEFNKIKESYGKNKLVFFFECLQICKEINKNKAGGVNILRYFLYHLNNKIIKNQFNKQQNNHLSNLYLKNESIPFDKIPFNFSLYSHNPNLADLFECIEVENRKDELLARYVKNNTQINGILYSNKEHLEHFKDIKELISSYNDKLYSKHKPQNSIVEWKGYFYIKSYEDNICAILEKIQRLSDEGIENFQSDIEKWLENADIDCEDKKAKLRDLFIHSRAVFIYGSAGVGKTKMIEHISHFFQDKNKLFVANTHSALANLKARIKSPDATFSTIAKAIKSAHCVDILIVDECSTISNNDMCKLLNKISCEVLVCVGDTFQIEAIKFGNWFEYVRNLVKQNAIIDLNKPYRTTSKNLLTLWNRVRTLEADIAEAISDFIKPLEAFGFRSDEGDEIVLCLNYGGLYGINNVNRIIQENNANKAFEFKGLIYKQGDPILFNETQRFSDEIHNNLKGKICEIKELQNGF